MKRPPLYLLGALLPVVLFLPLIPYLPFLMPYIGEAVRRVTAP